MHHLQSDRQPKNHPQIDHHPMNLSLLFLLPILFSFAHTSSFLNSKSNHLNTSYTFLSYQLFYNLLVTCYIYSFCPNNKSMNIWYIFHSYQQSSIQQAIFGKCCSCSRKIHNHILYMSSHNPLPTLSAPCHSCLCMNTSHSLLRRLLTLRIFPLNLVNNLIYKPCILHHSQLANNRLAVCSIYRHYRRNIHFCTIHIFCSKVCTKFASLFLSCLLDSLIIHKLSNGHRFSQLVLIVCQEVIPIILDHILSHLLIPIGLSHLLIPIGLSHLQTPKTIKQVVFHLLNPIFHLQYQFQQDHQNGPSMLSSSSPKQLSTFYKDKLIFACFFSIIIVFLIFGFIGSNRN